MQQPLVSIITPCYNSEKYIAETLESVLNQTYQHWEMLITDDGSTDNSVKTVKSYVQKDARIQLFEIKNAGAAVARNHAIKIAKGTFIAFLDSDDLWLPFKLERQIAFMAKNDYSFTFTSYQKMNEQGVVQPQTVKVAQKLAYKNMLYSNKIGCLTAIYNQDVLGKVYMPLIRKRQDYGLWLHLLKQIPFAYGLDEVLAVYRVREASVSSKKIEMLQWNYKLFREVEEKSVIFSFLCVLFNVLLKIKNR